MYNRQKRDENKIAIGTQTAFSRTFDKIDPFDFISYGIYYTRSANLEDIMRDYEKLQQIYRKAHSRKALTIFDKALCIAFVLKKYKTFGSIKKDTPKRISLLNERFIAETMIAFLHFSEYSIRDSKGEDIIPPAPFNLETCQTSEEQHNLERLINKITLLLSEPTFNADAIEAALMELYMLTILTENGLSKDLESELKKRIKIKEASKAPNINYEESAMYQLHQESMKGKYKRR